MKRKWEKLNVSIDRMVAAKKRNVRVSVFNKLILHAKIWNFFKEGTRIDMGEELDRQLRFHCNDVITVRSRDISSFREINRLLTTLFHNSRMVKNGFKILQERIREIRRIEKERNYELLRNYLLADEQRGYEKSDALMEKIYLLPPEIFKHIHHYLE